MPVEIPKEKHMREGLRAIRRHLQPFNGQIVVILALSVISAAANGSVPYITGRFFDALIDVSKHQAVPGSLPLWGILLTLWAVVQLVANNIDWILDRLRRRVDTSLHIKIQADGFIHLLLLPLSYHKNAHINGVLHHLSQAGWRVSNIFRTVISIGPQILGILIGITLAASINGLMALIMLIGVVLYVGLLLNILRPVAAIDLEAHRMWNESWDESAARVHQIESVKQAAAEEYEIAKIREELVHKTSEIWFELERTWSNVGFFQRMIVFVTQLVIFILSVSFVASGTITVGELLALNGYAAMFFGPFVSLGYSWQTIQNGITSAANAEEIFKQKEELYSPEGSTALDTITGKIDFKNVTFRYGVGQPSVLSNISLSISPGEVIALVGESGVGKSTTISLISGYYFPSEGSVTVDGIDTNRIDLTSLRRQIAVVPQEVALFNDTLRMNIKYGSFDASDEEMERVTKEAHLDEFVATLPKGFDTLVGERGVKLSVGQKQRVAIARAILRDPAILILDEPTSALDAKIEQIVTAALEKLMRGRTTFIVAHRLSTVRKADKILVFEKGKIVETGTHQELLKLEGGVYRHLYEYQIGLH